MYQLENLLAVSDVIEFQAKKQDEVVLSVLGQVPQLHGGRQDVLTFQRKVDHFDQLRAEGWVNSQR